MKILFTIFFFILSISFSFGQVFFKQRVYGMENREPKEEVQVRVLTYRDSPRRSTGSYSGSYGSYSASSFTKNSQTYKIDNYPKKTNWENQNLGVIKRFGQYYIYSKKTNKAIPLKKAKEFFKTEMNEPYLSSALGNARGSIGFGKGLQWGSIVIGGPILMVTAMSGFDSDITSGTGGVIIGFAGVFVLGKLLTKTAQKSIENNLNRYNSKLSIEKQFAPNFRPSKITFKPVQISPFTPALIPTLGCSWKL